MVEQRAVGLSCGSELLQGVLALPPVAPAKAAVVIVVGGPQYRAGSHRQFVLLARALAAAGFAVLRFDCRGMGDSSGAFPGFEHIGDDIAAAIDGACRLAAVDRVYLWGLCDGASAALLYGEQRRDPRVAALCLLNPWARSDASLARTHFKHYYARRLLQPDFWTKLLRGGVAVDALTGFVENVRQAVGDRTRPAAGRGVSRGVSFRDRMAAGWKAFDGGILLLLSGRDLTAREFADHIEVDAAWRGALTMRGVRRHDLPDADHTFSTRAARVQADSVVVDWLLQQEARR